MRIGADPRHFVGLNYYNPPGGSHTVLNCKIARCRVTWTGSDGTEIALATGSRAALEILTDLDSHGVPVVA
jgi:hypothetical protein